MQVIASGEGQFTPEFVEKERATGLKQGRPLWVPLRAGTRPAPTKNAS